MDTVAQGASAMVLADPNDTWQKGRLAHDRPNAFRKQ